MQNIMVAGHSAQKLEWKQTDARTDGRTEAIALPPSLIRSIITLSTQAKIADYAPGAQSAPTVYENVSDTLASTGEYVGFTTS